MYGDGWTPLMACCVAGHLGIARVLLERAGPDAHSLVLSANRYGLTAGHIAARRGDLQLLMLLLQYAGRDVSKVCPFLWQHRPMHAPHLFKEAPSMMFGFGQAVLAALGLPLARGFQQPWSCIEKRSLHAAPYRSSIWTCGCAQAKDSNGETPIIVAAKYKHASAVQLLTDALVFPKAPWGGHLPTPYNLGGHMPSKRQSLERPACH